LFNAEPQQAAGARGELVSTPVVGATQGKPILSRGLRRRWLVYQPPASS